MDLVADPLRCAFDAVTGFGGIGEVYSNGMAGCCPHDAFVQCRYQPRIAPPDTYEEFRWQAEAAGAASSRCLQSAGRGTVTIWSSRSRDRSVPDPEDIPSRYAHVRHLPRLYLIDRLQTARLPRAPGATELRLVGRAWEIKRTQQTAEASRYSNTGDALTKQSIEEASWLPFPLNRKPAADCSRTQKPGPRHI
jgi:hypothetical protein